MLRATDPPLFQLIPDSDHRAHLSLLHAADTVNNVTSFLVGENLFDVINNGSIDDRRATTAASEEPGCCEMGYERIIVPVIFCAVVVSGCIGNLLVLVVVVRNREQFTSTTNLFIVNLAVADLFFLVFCVPFHAVIYTTIGWPFGDAMCKLVHFVQFTSMTASVYTLVAMSIDRFLAVGYPLRTKHLRTPPCALAVAVVVWSVSAVLGAPWSVVYTVREYQYEDVDGSMTTFAACADDWSWVGRGNRPTAFLVLFFVGYAIPLSSIGVLSALTVRQLWATETTNDGPSRRRSVIAKRRVTRLIAVVVGVFAVCWLPMHVVWLWTNYFPLTWHHDYSFYYGKITAHVLSYANSSMNPIIYAFLSSRFRREFRRAIRCQRSVGSSGTAGSRFIGGASSIGPGSRRALAMVDLETADGGHRTSQCYNFRAPPTDTTQPGKSTTSMMLMLTAATTSQHPGQTTTGRGKPASALDKQMANGSGSWRHRDDEDEDAVVL